MLASKTRKVFILVGNPHLAGFTAELADAYEGAAREASHEVRRMNIGELVFDPILHKGYSAVQPLEPDLVAVQENIRWADHFVVLYPNWWISMPALLKGMFDRMWLPGFAFNFDKETHAVRELLSGKTARVIVIDGSHSPFMTRLMYGDYTNEISRGILGFAGMNVQVTTMGPCEHTDRSHHDAWVAQVCELGTDGV
jgi:NAD(P)H dehydrogenase (quinone)